MYNGGASPNNEVFKIYCNDENEYEAWMKGHIEAKSGKFGILSISKDGSNSVVQVIDTNNKQLFSVADSGLVTSEGFQVASSSYLANFKVFKQTGNTKTPAFTSCLSMLRYPDSGKDPNSVYFTADGIYYVDRNNTEGV